MKNATFRQLRIFVEVAKQLSFVRAAETLYLTPPAVSMQIKDLESSIGLALFQRQGPQGRKVALTSVGEYLLVYARKILSTIKDAEDALDKLRSAESGEITIGIVVTSCYFMLPLIAAFQNTHPNVQIRILTANRDTLAKQLELSEVDVAIMGRPPASLSSWAIPFFPNPLYFVSSPNHFLAQQEINLRQLADCQILIREHGSGTRSALENFSNENSIEFNKKLEFANHEVLKQGVIANLGISFMSLHTVANEISNQQICLLNLPNTPILRYWHVVRHSAKLLSPLAEAFFQYMSNEAEQFMKLRYDQG